MGPTGHKSVQVSGRAAGRMGSSAAATAAQGGQCVQGCPGCGACGLQTGTPLFARTPLSAGGTGLCTPVCSLFDYLFRSVAFWDVVQSGFAA